MTLTITDQIILSSARIYPATDDIRRLNKLLTTVTDWDETILRVINRGAGPLLYKKLPLLSSSELIPLSAREKLKQSYFLTMSRSMLLYASYSKVIELLSDSGIKVVAMKGIHLAEWLYRDVGLRQMSDIDLLVDIGDGEKCVEILKKNGYRSTHNVVSDMIMEQSGVVHYQPLVKDGMSVEIHINLHRKRKQYQLISYDFIANAQPMVLNHTKSWVFELHYQIIFLCIHLDKHFVKGEIQFTCFYDIFNLLEIKSAEIRWDFLLELCKKYKAENIVFKYIIILNRFFNCQLPSFIIDNYHAVVNVKDVKLFLHYLRGFEVQNYEFSSHIKNLKQIKGLAGKLKYLFLVIFPAKEFIVQTYQVKNPALFWLYYPKRHIKGLTGFFKMLFEKR